MRCMYCGGEVVETDGQNVCSNCGRSFRARNNNDASIEEGVSAVASSGLKKIIPTGNLGSKVDVNALLNKELEKEGVVVSTTVPPQKTKEMPAKTEAEARKAVKEKIGNLEELREELSVAEAPAEELGFDVSAYKNIDVKDTEMVKEAAMDLLGQTTKNAKTFKEMFKSNAGEFVGNLKNTFRKDGN